MKTLILMRHAEAAASQGADFERPLTPQGIRMAQEIGVELSRKALWPDMVLCSSALRTRQTCQNILDVWKDDVAPHVMYDPALYRMDAHELLELAREQDTEHHCIMMIGHNPSIHLASLLIAAEGEIAKVPEIKEAFPPSSCVIYSFEGEDWLLAGKGKGVLTDYFFASGT